MKLASNVPLVRRTVASPIGQLELVASPAGLRAVLWPGEDGSRVARGLAPQGRSAPQERRPDQVQADALGPSTAGDAGAVPESAARADVSALAQAEAHLDRAEVQLAQYFAGTRREFDVALDPVGTPFQRQAWEVLRTIPYGATMSYGDQARALGDASRARAVGAANGRNPLSIVVPCHRVVATSGSLTGFAGGLDVKAWLLEHERRVVAAP